MWKFAETNWSILAGHVCTPFVIEQKRNIFSGKWEHKYHKLAWSIWPLDLLHMYHHLWVILHIHPVICALWSFSPMHNPVLKCAWKKIWVIVWNPTKQNRGFVNFAPYIQNTNIGAAWPARQWNIGWFCWRHLMWREKRNYWQRGSNQ